MNGLKVSPSPHLHDNISTQRVMLNVIIALLPACAAGIYIFGYMAAVNLAVCVVSCVLFEFCLFLTLRFVEIAAKKMRKIGYEGHKS